MLLSALPLLLSATEHRESEKICLNKGWEFSQAGKEEWFPATVPGNIQKDYAIATSVKVVAEGETMAITGIYTSYGTGAVYNVTVKTNVVVTAVENICVEPQATKIIRNGQLVICKDSVEYHVAGGCL